MMTTARRQGAYYIWTGLAFGALIMASSMAARLALARGVSVDADLPQRLTMIILGGFFVFTGNAMPKLLTPLSMLRCDAARAQALQRLTGWMWVLSGLGVALAWIVAPPTVAEPVSVALILGGALAVLARAVWLRRASHKAA